MPSLDKGMPNEPRLYGDTESHPTELADWSERTATELATKEGIQLGAEHMEVIHLLRNHYRLHGHDMSGTKLLRALEEPFGRRGGRKHLFELNRPGFQGGPLG